MLKGISDFFYKKREREMKVKVVIHKTISVEEKRKK